MSIKITFLALALALATFVFPVNGNIFDPVVSPETTVHLRPNHNFNLTFVNDVTRKDSLCGQVACDYTFESANYTLEYVDDFGVNNESVEVGNIKNYADVLPFVLEKSGIFHLRVDYNLSTQLRYENTYIKQYWMRSKVVDFQVQNTFISYVPDSNVTRDYPTISDYMNGYRIDRIRLVLVETWNRRPMTQMSPAEKLPIVSLSRISLQSYANDVVNVSINWNRVSELYLTCNVGWNSKPVTDHFAFLPNVPDAISHFSVENVAAENVTDILIDKPFVQGYYQIVVSKGDIVLDSRNIWIFSGLVPLPRTDSVSQKSTISSGTICGIVLGLCGSIFLIGLVCFRMHAQAKFASNTANETLQSTKSRSGSAILDEESQLPAYNGDPPSYHV